MQPAAGCRVPWAELKVTQEGDSPPVHYLSDEIFACWPIGCGLRKRKTFIRYPLLSLSGMLHCNL